MSAPGITVSSLPVLPVAGLKDSSGDMSRLHGELDTFDGWIYTGSADLVLAAGALGCAGIILAIADVEPEQAVAAASPPGRGGARLGGSSRGRAP
jgi:dihydrodipicolinate synthase/N-acetylneuraminate lyase